jgi:putative colanic acid biosynthesis acetyltransferase WcaF
MKTYSQSSPYASPWTTRERIGLLVWSVCWPLFCAWTPKPLNGWRLLWLRLFGTTLRGRPFVHQRARIALPWHVTLHDRACVGDRANLYSLGEIEIHADATVAQEVISAPAPTISRVRTASSRPRKSRWGRVRSFARGRSCCRA